MGLSGPIVCLLEVRSVVEIVSYVSCMGSKNNFQAGSRAQVFKEAYPA